MGDYFEAIRRGDRKRVERAVTDDPPRVRAPDEHGVPALLLALYHGHEELARFLADRAGDLTAAEAAALGDVEALRARLEEEPEARDRRSVDGFPPLALAAFFGREEALDLLLERGADPNRAATSSAGVRPLHSALAHRDPEVSSRLARKLLESGADPNVRQAGGWTPLHQAAAHGRVDLVELLLARGADGGAESEDGSRPRDLAARAGHREVVARLSE